MCIYAQNYTTWHVRLWQTIIDVALLEAKWIKEETSTMWNQLKIVVKVILAAQWEGGNLMHGMHSLQA
jgi:hypothetical protein